MPSFRASRLPLGSESPHQPFAALTICVTGLSKEARKQVKDATERLGGQYSPNLHPHCTHLIVQSFRGRKFEHALKHGSKNGLFVVALGWFVDSVRRNVRLSESLYTVKNLEDNGVRLDDLNRLVGFGDADKSCIPIGVSGAKQFDSSERTHKHGSWRSSDLIFYSASMYVDPDISNDLKIKVREAASQEGATFLDQWFAGCGVSHIVCEEASVPRYLGHTNNIVTPLWVLKTVKEKNVQRLVHISADLARQVASLLENSSHGILGKDAYREVTQHADAGSSMINVTQANREKIVDFAKQRVRDRRGRRMQTCQTPLRPLTPSSLLESICWSLSEPASAASVYTDCVSSEDTSEYHTSEFHDAKGDARDLEASFANLTRRLTEREKTELVFRSHFLTILFPIDRFSEIGPTSRTFFSDGGFTCLQVLDHIYEFYQENMSAAETEVAIHADSRYADRLRAVYCSKETGELGYVKFKRIELLGSRRSFEMLKRVTGDNSSNVYELLIRA
ncbi:DNA topoisomerase 2-binding protein 1 [Linum grandiflorum]